MFIDLKSPRKTAPQSLKWRFPAVLTVLAITAVALLFYHQSTTETEAHTAVVEIHAPASPLMPENPQKIIDGVISPGDTITTLLGDYFSTQELHSLDRQSRKIFPLTGICAGQNFRLCVNEGAFEKFEYDINRDDQLIITRAEDGFDITRVPIAYEVKTTLVRGVIRTHLFDAVAESGEGAELALALGDIFAWDINFIRDLRQGDSFQVLVEKRFREGAPAGYGKISAAEFTNQGKTHRAFLFKDGKHPSSYYDANGNSLRKAFLKAPLSFSRISSGFTMKRFHPITKTWKSHPAIDYAAPTGTPVMAIGNGSITSIGYTKGNGNFIKIGHQNGYQSIYLHMSKFAKGMKKGKRVNQGQVIGFVGSTGLATGPHLCFRMTRNGAPINPNGIKSVASAPIAKETIPVYKTAIAPFKARFESVEYQALDTTGETPIEN